jgi:plasmid stability protein
VRRGGGAATASITIRNLDAAQMRRLRIRAAERNRSVEDEVRDILRIALAREAPPTQHLVDAIRERIDIVGGIDLPPPPREPMREPPDFK